MKKLFVVLAAILLLSIMACSSGGSGSSPIPITHMLRVDKFGQGVITADSGNINCGTNCTQQYNDGTNVTLTANASSGWQIDHWVGCDTTNGNTCTVKINADKIVYPTFSTTETKVKTEVKILDAATLSLLKNQSGSTLIFDISATAILALNPGDIIISQSGNGWAKRVKAVTVLAGSSIFVDTEDANLEDIIQEGTIIFHQQLSNANIKSSKVLLKGVKKRAVKAVDVSHTYDINSTVGPLNISGSTTLTFEPDFAAAFDIFGITEFKSDMKITHSSSLTVSSSTSVSFVDQEIPIAEITFAPVLIGPVLLVPIMEIKLTVKGDSEVGLTAGITYSEKATIGVRYIRSEGWMPVHDYSKSYDIQQPTLTGSVSLQAGVGADINVLIYGVVGPYASLEAYLKVEAKETVISSQNCIDWGLYLGVDASAGAEIKIISWSLANYDVNLFDEQWPLLSSSKCQDTAPPSVPSNLKAQAVSSSEIKLTWDNSTDNIMVAGYNINRNSARVGSTATNAYTDSNLTPNTKYCYSISAYDQSNNESSLSNTVCTTTNVNNDTSPPTAPQNLSASALSSSAVQLKWDASSDDTGVAGYIIFRNSSPIGSVNSLLGDDIGLKSNTKYCYKVLAYDNAGNKSALSNEACATTNSLGSWDIYLKCERLDYDLKNNLDLNQMITSDIQVTGTGTDYDGTSLAYVITGTYNTATSVFDGEMTISSQGNTCVRVDDFSANLSTGDSGDVQMNQVHACGCTADIRFVTAGTPIVNSSIKKSSPRSKLTTNLFGKGK